MPISQVETPAVPIAFDDVAVKARIRQRVAFMRAKVLDRAEMAGDIKKGDLGAVFELHGRPAAGRDRFRTADRNDLSGALRFSLVVPMLSHILQKPAR